ncbi:hypothetical protein BC833DRAFT_619044 [Globomyces pollinis-pini]|nr:hypothetical protein BC833DRAFT_619044 [Globomyces pollinis-pini]
MKFVTVICLSLLSVFAAPAPQGNVKVSFPCQNDASCVTGCCVSQRKVTGEVGLFCKRTQDLKNGERCGNVAKSGNAAKAGKTAKAGNQGKNAAKGGKVQIRGACRNDASCVTGCCVSQRKVTGEVGLFCKRPQDLKNGERCGNVAK